MYDFPNLGYCQNRLGGGRGCHVVLTALGGVSPLSLLAVASPLTTSTQIMTSLPAVVNPAPPIAMAFRFRSLCEVARRLDLLGRDPYWKYKGVSLCAPINI